MSTQTKNQQSFELRRLELLALAEQEQRNRVEMYVQQIRDAESVAIVAANEYADAVLHCKDVEHIRQLGKRADDLIRQVSRMTLKTDNQ